MREELRASVGIAAPNAGFVQAMREQLVQEEQALPKYGVEKEKGPGRSMTLGWGQQ